MLGFRVWDLGFGDITTIMENQVEKEMDTTI